MVSGVRVRVRARLRGAPAACVRSVPRPFAAFPMRRTAACSLGAPLARSRVSPRSSPEFGGGTLWEVSPSR
eukprot:scaffold19147_cov42-Phaeocystis_antarctica.AAC.1